MSDTVLAYRSACSNPVQHGLTVEIVLANVVPVTTYDGYPFTINSAPCRVIIYITYGNVRLAANQGLHFLEQQLTQMTVTSAVDDELKQRHPS